MKGLWPEDREAITGLREKGSSKIVAKTRQDGMICASIERDTERERQNDGMLKGNKLEGRRRAGMTENGNNSPPLPLFERPLPQFTANVIPLCVYVCVCQECGRQWKTVGQLSICVTINYTAVISKYFM